MSDLKLRTLFQTTSGDIFVVYSGFISVRGLNSSVKKGIWWMPWQSEAMKDVAGCEKSR